MESEKEMLRNAACNQVENESQNKNWHAAVNSYTLIVSKQPQTN